MELSSADLDRMRSRARGLSRCSEKLAASVEDVVEAQKSGDDPAVERALLEMVTEVAVTTASMRQLHEVVRAIVPEGDDR